MPLGREAMERGSSSFFNEIEAQCVAAVVRSLRSVADDGGPTLLASPLSVGGTLASMLRRHGGYIT